MRKILIGLILLTSMPSFASNCSVTLYESQLGDEKSKISFEGQKALMARGYYWTMFDERNFPSSTLSTSSSCSTNFFGFKSCSYSVQIGTRVGNSMQLSRPVSASSIDKAISKLMRCN